MKHKNNYYSCIQTKETKIFTGKCKNSLNFRELLITVHKRRRQDDSPNVCISDCFVPRNDGEGDRNDDARRPSLRMGIKNQTAENDDLCQPSLRGTKQSRILYINVLKITSLVDTKQSNQLFSYSAESLSPFGGGRGRGGVQ